MSGFQIDLKQQLEWIAEGLEAEQPQVASALRKWRPLIFESAKRVARITRISEEDVLGEILLAVASVCELYREPLYRYGGGVYRLCDTEGDTVLIETPRTHKNMRKLWVKRDQVTLVKRAKVGSLLYKHVQQHCVNTVRKVFTQKRGYDKETGRLPHMVYWDFMEDFVQSRPEASAFSAPTNREVGEHLVDTISNPESAVSVAQTVQGFIGISDVSLQVLSGLIDDPAASNQKLSRQCGMTARRVGAARLEIVRTFFHMHGESAESLRCQPIYIRADQV